MKTAINWDTNTRNPNHERGRSTRHMLHPTASHMPIKHTPNHDKGRSLCPLKIIETSITEGAAPNPSLHCKLTEYSATRLQESGQSAVDWNTNTRSPKHGGARIARHTLHPSASKICVKLTPKKDTGGSNGQLINKETIRTEGAEPNPSLHYKQTKYSATKLKESGQTATDW
jgi:hypothetical protein